GAELDLNRCTSTRSRRSSVGLGYCMEVPRHLKRSTSFYNKSIRGHTYSYDVASLKKLFERHRELKPGDPFPAPTAYDHILRAHALTLPYVDPWTSTPTLRELKDQLV